MNLCGTVFSALHTFHKGDSGDNRNIRIANYEEQVLHHFEKYHANKYSCHCTCDEYKPLICMGGIKTNTWIGRGDQFLGLHVHQIQRRLNFVLGMILNQWFTGHSLNRRSISGLNCSCIQ